MKIKILLFLALMATLTISVLAKDITDKGVSAVNLTTPNATWSANGNFYHGFNVTGNSTNYSCELYNDIGGIWAASGLAGGNVSNSTNTTITTTGSANNQTGYKWNVGCNLGSDVNSTVVYADANYTFYVDTVAPVVRPIYPGYINWTTNRSMVFSFTASDVNNQSCVMETNLNTSEEGGRSGNTTGGLSDLTATGFWNTSGSLLSGFKNGTQNNLTFGFEKYAFGVMWLENNTGIMKWNVRCNDTAGNIGRFVSGNVTFFTDVTPPTQPNASFPANFTRSSDLTPLFKWLNSTELNFSRYVLQVDDSSDFSSLYFERNITGVSTNFSIVTTELSKYDITYYWRVLAYDLAGNNANSSNTTIYRTDRWCSLLTTGWNICAWTETTARNASSICDDIACTYIAKYNASHEFQTYTSGSATNDEMEFNSSSESGGGTQPILTNRGDNVIFIYVASNTSWGNRTWQTNQPNFFYNLTNYSTGWNSVPILNQSAVINFGKLDRSINGNGSYHRSNVSRFQSLFSAENGTGYKYTPFVTNRSINNATNLRYGSVVWIHVNKTINLSYLWNSSGEITD